jgi:hypothetical protein
VAFRKSKLKSKKYCVIDIQAILEEWLEELWKKWFWYCMVFL